MVDTERPAEDDVNSGRVLEREDLERLVQLLAGRGYRTLGPVVRNGAIVHGALASVQDLPAGWHDEQAPGSYRLRHDDGDQSLFGWAVGPSSYKSEFFPAHQTEWRGRIDGGTLRLEPSGDPPGPTAIIGARPCEAAALGVLDRVLDGGAVPDPAYGTRRRGTFLVVAECGSPSSSCFCTSMGTGPAAGGTFDLALTELGGAGEAPRYLARAGSEAGRAVLGELGGAAAEAVDLDARAGVLASARAAMGPPLDSGSLPALLARNLDHPRFDDVAERCLSCGNCTLVCPTCFCSDVRDVTELDGTLERRRSWASCFDLDHSHMSAGAARRSTRSRYRQWMTHKLSTWWDQFGTSGCVGCGRCVTWCPVGIDLRDEWRAIQSSDGALAGAQPVTIGRPGTAGP